MRGWLRRLIRPWWMRWIVMPIAAIVALHAVITLAQGWRFDARISDLDAAGEPILFDEWDWSRARRKESTAPSLREADDWYEEHLQADQSDYVRRIHSEFVGTSEVDAERLAPWREWLARGDPYVELLGKVAARLRTEQAPNWRAAYDLSNDPSVYRASAFLVQRIVRAEHATEQQVRELSVMLHIARIFERSYRVNVQSRWEFEGHAADALEKLSKKPGFDARAARRSLDGLFSAALDPSVAKDALRGERARGVGFASWWIAGESPFQYHYQVMGIPERWRPEPDSDPPSDSLWSSWWMRPLAYRDAARFLDLMDAAIAAADMPPRAALSRAEELEREYGRSLPNVVSHVYAGVPRFLMSAQLRHVAQMRVARVGLAILELRQTQGGWPRTLESVIPLVGAEAVVDPYTDSRLQYEPGVRLKAMVPPPEEPSPTPGLADYYAWMYQVEWQF